MTNPKSFLSRATFLQSSRFWTILVASIVAAFCVALSLSAYFSNDNIYRQTSAISTSWLPSIDGLSKFRTELNEGRRAEAFLIFGGNCAPLTCSEESTRHREKLFLLEKYYGKSLISSAEESVLFDAYLRQRSIYFRIQDELLSKSDISDKMRKYFLAESADSYTDLLRSITNLGDFNLAGAAKAQDAATKDYDKNRRILVYLLCGSSAILMVLLGRALMLMLRLTKY